LHTEPVRAQNNGEKIVPVSLGDVARAKVNCPQGYNSLDQQESPSEHRLPTMSIESSEALAIAPTPAAGKDRVFRV
jgi:hypothetical protein